MKGASGGAPFRPRVPQPEAPATGSRSRGGGNTDGDDVVSVEPALHGTVRNNRINQHVADMSPYLRGLSVYSSQGSLIHLSHPTVQGGIYFYGAGEKHLLTQCTMSPGALRKAQQRVMKSVSIPGAQKRPIEKKLKVINSRGTKALHREEGNRRPARDRRAQCPACPAEGRGGERVRSRTACRQWS